MNFLYFGVTVGVVAIVLAAVMNSAHLTPEAQFWWNWWATALAGIGALSASAVALFGQAFRAKYFPPVLSLKVRCPEGVRVPVRLHSGSGEHEASDPEDARFYHITVSNSRRWSPATEVQVFLVAIDTLGLDGEVRQLWVGETPMRWRGQEYSPVARKIGTDWDCDICRIVKGKGLALSPLVVPYNLPVGHSGPCVLILALQARAMEADSDAVCVQIAWDGKWEDGAQEMRNHMTFKMH